MAKARMRHIALSVKDSRKAADFLINAYGLEEVGGFGRGTIYLSDGTINIAMLARDTNRIDNKTKNSLVSTSNFEIKYRTPMGKIFDVNTRDRGGTV